MMFFMQIHASEIDFHLVIGLCYAFCKQLLILQIMLASSRNWQNHPSRMHLVLVFKKEHTELL